MTKQAKKELILLMTALTLGMSAGLFCHSSSCTNLKLKSVSQEDSGRRLGQARFCQAVGMRSRYKEVFSASIASDIVSSPAKPN